jgi:tungstate transport system permease protein
LKGRNSVSYLSEGFIQGLGLIFTMNEEVWTAVITTLKLSFLSMAVTLALGIPGGFILGYFSFPGRRILRIMVDTLLSIPTVVVGLFVYAFISNRGPLGGYGLLFSIPGMAIGQTILALPIVVALTASAVESVDDRLRLTLLTLGARGKRLALSTLWESRHQILLAAVTAYGRVTAEVGVSMMIGGNIKWHTRTITTAITLETGKGEFSTGIALGVLLLGLSFVLNWSLAALRRRTAS